MDGLRRNRPLLNAALLLVAVAALPGCAESASGETHVYVLDEIRLQMRAEEVNGVLISDGFDLDGQVGPVPGSTCSGRTDADFTAPDGRSGIDNSFASEALAGVIRFVGDTGEGGSALAEGLVQNSVTSGSLLILLRFDGVHSFVNDDDVRMTILFGQPFAVGVGTDGRLLSGQTFAPRTDVEPIVVRTSIRDGVLLASGISLQLTGSIREFPLDMPLSLGQFRFRFNSNGTMAGAIGGSLPWRSMLDVIEAVDRNFLPIGTSILRGSADVMSVETGMCDGLSMAMRVHGVGAHLFEESAPSADAGMP